MRQLFQRTVYRLVLISVLLAMPAQAWEEPDHWSKIGLVQTWMDLDARFYRTFDDNRFVDRSQFGLEQQETYAQTRLYGGLLPGVSIEEFQSLGRKDRIRRAEMASGKLDPVERYLMRVHNQVQKVRENLSSGWGDNISDVTVLGDCLVNLGDAIGLDPSNPYAWHLQSYFAMCAGDELRSRQYLDGAVEALMYVPAGALTEVKGRVALDLAWLQRNGGDFDLALANVDLAERMTGRDLETTLLRGLILAQTGQSSAAGDIAATLRSVDVRKFPKDYNSADFQPELQDPANWKKISSRYLADWIMALTMIQEGNRELVYSAFGGYSLNDVYPFGWRFWNEAGFIYEITGRSAEAIKAWNAARMNRPWLRSMVYKPYALALGILTGHEAQVPFMLGYDRFYMAGSRLAFAASLVGKVGSAETEQDKQEWALRALDELEICQKAGIYSGQAAVLRGHVYYLLGDIPSTLTQLEEALVLLEKQRDLKVMQAVMKDLAAIRKNQQGGNGLAFLQQSGNSRGRWEAEPDPEGRERELQAQLAADPDDREAAVDLARFLIRHDRPAEGKELITTHGGDRGSVEVVVLILEADRLLGEGDLALSLVKQLEAGKDQSWNDSGLWSLVGTICQEQNHEAKAVLALKHALALDPENQGLRMQLRLMGE